MNLFTQIEDELTRNQHGWCTVEKAHALAAAVLALKPATVVEIGVWAGRSCLPMALACSYNHKGNVVAIDPWSTAASAEGMTGANLDWWKVVPHEDIYQIFLSEMNRLDLAKYITINRAKSDDVDPPPNIGLLHVDGNHSAQAIRDVERFGPNVILGGFTFCDDVTWIDGGVGEAVKRLTGMGFTNLYNLDTGAMFQRTELK